MFKKYNFLFKALLKKRLNSSADNLFSKYIEKTSYKNINVGTKRESLNIIKTLSNKQIQNTAINLFKLKTLTSKKLNITLGSKIPFHEIGKIKVLIETNILKKQNIKPVFLNIYLFFICKLTKKYAVKLDIFGNFIQYLNRKKNKIKKLNKKKNFFQILSQKNIAIFYHMSKKYGRNLYSKNHLISGNPNSLLAKKNVYELFLPSNNLKIPTKEKKINIVLGIKFFLNCIIKARKLSEVLGVLILTKIYYNYLLWKTILGKTNLKTIIFDYDILVPKELCLACESLKITTVALQERPQMSLNNFYGVIFDHYFYAGKNYLKYGRQNYFHAVKNPNIASMWRLQYFRKPSRRTIRIKFFDKETNCPKKNYILFLGYFLDKTNMNPVTTQIACIDFVKQASEILKDFPKILGILRFKECGKDLTKVIMPFLINNRCLALCDDYRYDGISYQLCKHSALIISLPTSLADEALQFGKNVLFFDKLTPFYDISTTCIPKENHHLIINEKNKQIKINALLKKTNRTLTPIKIKQTCCAKNIEKVLVDKN